MTGAPRRPGPPLNWGATSEEVADHYPCDDELPVADVAFFRALDVRAPQDVVFRWLCQLRVAPYSYDLVDNLGRRSPRRLIPGLERLEAGQRFMTIFTLVEVAPGNELTLRATEPVAVRAFGEVALTYRVRALATGGSRLVVKLQVRDGGVLGALRRRALAWGDLVMMRRQLLTLRDLAEGSAREP